MNYRFVASAPAGSTLRLVVVGAGPCGLFAGLVLAQMGEAGHNQDGPEVLPPEGDAVAVARDQAAVGDLAKPFPGGIRARANRRVGGSE
jgi:hypothetical protein